MALRVVEQPRSAAAWRKPDLGSFWKGVLPHLMFPADRSWLFSTLWDDDWSCLGGPAGLVGGFLVTLTFRLGRWRSGETPHRQVTERSDGARLCAE